MLLTARRMKRLECWSAPQAAGGTRLAFLPEIVGCVASVQLPANGGVDTLTVELPIKTASAAQLLEQRVLRVWEDDTRWDEWRIDARDRMPSAGIVRLTCSPIETFLAVRTAPISQVTAGICFYNIEIVGLKPSEIIDQYVLPALAGDGIAWLARGTIDKDTPIDVTLDWESPLALLHKIADALTLELQVRRNGTTGYLVDLLTAIGASAATVDVRYGKNLAEDALRTTTDEQVNRVFPRGADEDGVRATISRASWEVNTVVGSVVTLVDPAGGDGPIAFDGQLVGKFFRKADGTLTAVTASSAAAQSVTVASATGIAAGQLVQFRLNVDGDDLTFLDHPTEQATSGVVTGWPDYPDVPGTNNVIPNPAVRDWPAGDMPTDWAKIGAPVTSKNTTAPFFRTAPHSLKVIAADGEGVQTPAGNVFPSATKPHGSGYAGIWLESGQVRVELVVTTGSGTVVLPASPALATTALLGQWVDLGVSGEDLNAIGALSVRVRITAHGGAATFYVDRAQATESAAQLPFVEGSGGTRLWQLGNTVLRLRGAPIATFTVTMADLARVAPAEHPYDAIPELGATVNVTDARLFSATSGSRITALRINYLRPGETQLTISNRPEDLTGALARAATAARLSPAVTDASNADAGPTLDVNTTPGASSFTVNYVVIADVFEYSVDGSGWTSVPATGFTVSRPAAGANDKVLAFRAEKNGQSITNTITIPAIDKDTVSPDLTVTQTGQSPTDTSFQATASNPGGGAAPTITVEFVNCSGDGYVGAGPHTIASGTTVDVIRPDYGSHQASVKFKAVIAGAGTEEISHTVLNRVPGASLDVTAVPGATNFTINYTVTATTFEYSIDGAAFISVPASGFTVSRPAAGSNDKTLTFRAIKDDVTIVNTVTITAIDKDTVTPDLTVTQTGQSPTETSFDATVSNPGGGAAPTLTVEFVNCTGDGYAGAGPHTIASGTTVVVNRPAFAANQATVTFKAAIAGAGSEEISRTVPCQDGFGPSLDLTAVPGSTSYTINYTVSGTFDYSTDGGTYVSVPASGFTVSRNAINGAAKTLTFRVVKDSQTITLEVTIPAQTIPGISLALLAGVAGPSGGPYTTLDLDWTVSGMPAGVTYSCGYDNGGENIDSVDGLTTTAHQFTSVVFAGSPGKGAIYVDAIHDGKVIASAKRHKIYNI